MLRNISFIAIALILILCQKDHCHLSQLKKATIYSTNIHSFLAEYQLFLCLNL